jgi:tryptophan synthase alpha subunit
VLKASDAGLSADEKVKAADWLNFATQNTPLVNLFYVKPTLDYLFLNSMREAARRATASASKAALEGIRAAQHASEALAAVQLRSKPIVPPTTTTPIISWSQRFVSRSAALLPA